MSFWINIHPFWDWQCRINVKFPCYFPIIATQPHVCGKRLNQIPFWTNVYLNGSSWWINACHGFEHYKGWTNVFQPCFHEKQDFKLLNYLPRPCCMDVLHTFYSLEIIPFYITICEWNVDQAQCGVEFELQCGCVTVFTKVAS